MLKQFSITTDCQASDHCAHTSSRARQPTCCSSRKTSLQRVY